MAYTTGSPILRDDYNIFATGSASGTPTHTVNNINTLWGVGSGDKGYGQSTTLSAVAAGTQVTATQWATMIARMTTLASQQGSSITAITQPTAGTAIAAIAAITSNLTTLTNNRTNKVASGTDYSTNGVATSTSNWTNTQVATHTVTFASADQARYFFNAGGELRLNFSRTGGSSTTKNTNWTQLLTDVGTVVIGAQGTTKSGGAGTTTVLATTVGYYDCTTSDQTVFKQFATTSPYSVNYLQVDIKTSGTSGSNGDTGAIMTITVTFYDAEVDSFTDTVDGTLTSTLTVRPPSTTYLTNTWGTATLAASFATDIGRAISNVIGVTAGSPTTTTMSVGFTNPNGISPTVNVSVNLMGEYFSTTDKSSTVTISQANKSVTTAYTPVNWDKSIRATRALGTGQYYWETKLTNSGTNSTLPTIMIGVGKLATSLTNSYTVAGGYFGYGPWAGGYYANSALTSLGVTAAVNDVIGCAFDGTANTIRWYKNGVAMGGAVSIGAGPWYPMNCSYSGEGFVYNFGDTAFAYAIPGGYTNCFTNNTTTNIQNNTGITTSPYSVTGLTTQQTYKFSVSVAGQLGAATSVTAATL